MSNQRIQFLECSRNYRTKLLSHLTSGPSRTVQLDFTKNCCIRCHQSSINEGEPGSKTLRDIPGQRMPAAFLMVAVFAPRMIAAYQLEHVPLPHLLEKDFVSAEEGHDRGSERVQSADRLAGQRH